ncbi:MAG: hypothetical protein NT124_00785 [Candidatus Dependentiae bacterium]|nr:hypothetical protein [Candidatus Dependentiae bacterium]
MKKSFLTLALLMSTLASAKIHVDVSGALNSNGSTQNFKHVIEFDKAGDKAESSDENSTISYTLTEATETTATLELEISRNNAQGEAELIAQPTVIIEFEKEATFILENEQGESLTLAITAHNE